MDRREFASMVPALLAMTALMQAKAQSVDSAASGSTGKDSKPVQKALKQLSSGTFKPGPAYGTLPKRLSHRYMVGMLEAGDIRLEMHETIQEIGADHEPVEILKHNEIFLVQRGVASLFLNGTEHRLEAGDVGLVCVGDTHWVKNIGDTELAYFVVSLGPRE
jgi:mannose-6-phosphate isomerase-like protein (cupin superfamily)